MYVSVFMALITTLVLCARSQDFVMSVSVRRLHVVLSTAGFKGEGKPCRKTRETAALRRGIQKSSVTLSRFISPVAEASLGYSDIS